MTIKEMLAMIVPKWLRREPLPTAKVLREQRREKQASIARHADEISTICGDRRRERTGEIDEPLHTCA